MMELETIIALTLLIDIVETYYFELFQKMNNILAIVFKWIHVFILRFSF
jgi:hypothetical protein